jgi:transcriptional regulator with XRE-family HTH domain
MAETMGDRIRGLRARKRITQAGLAHMVGISPTAMNAIEADAVDPRLSRVLKIAEALDVSLDYLVGHKVKRQRELWPAMPELVETAPGMAVSLTSS